MEDQDKKLEFRHTLFDKVICTMWLIISIGNFFAWVILVIHTGIKSKEELLWICIILIIFFIVAIGGVINFGFRLFRFRLVINDNIITIYERNMKTIDLNRVKSCTRITQHYPHSKYFSDKIVFYINENHEEKVVKIKCIFGNEEKFIEYIETYLTKKKTDEYLNWVRKNTVYPEA